MPTGSLLKTEREILKTAGQKAIKGEVLKSQRLHPLAQDRNYGEPVTMTQEKGIVFRHAPQRGISRYQSRNTFCM